MRRKKSPTRRDRQLPPARVLVPKLCGADVELGNFILGAEETASARDAARLLLTHVDGVPSSHQQPLTGRRLIDPQDRGRKYLRETGGAIYIDLDHLEACTPEVLSAYDFVASWHATLRVVRRAQQAARATLPENCSLQVLVNNSDGLGHSYGGHLNVLLARPAWEALFERRLHHMLFLASYQVSSILFTGQGKVGSENGQQPIDFQIQQRADFIETLTGPQTTYRRPIVNSRDEALTGRGPEGRPQLARLHCIFYDSTLCHTATLLKVGVLQVLLAMIEANEVDGTLILDDPVGALHAFSHDATLEAQAETVAGERLSALDLQFRFLELATRFVASGRCDEAVPGAREIVRLWEDTLARFARGDWETLTRRLDWVLKLSIVDHARRELGLQDWSAPELKHLDHVYSSLDPDDGLYWAYERAGIVERVADEAQIEALVKSPPEDTRAWTRAMLLRRAPVTRIDEIDWDFIRFRGRDRGREIRRTVSLADPLGHTRAASAPLLAAGQSLDDWLDALGAQSEPAPVETTLSSGLARDGWTELKSC